MRKINIGTLTLITVIAGLLLFIGLAFIHAKKPEYGVTVYKNTDEVAAFRCSKYQDPNEPIAPGSGTETIYCAVKNGKLYAYEIHSGAFPGIYYYKYTIDINQTQADKIKELISDPGSQIYGMISVLISDIKTESIDNPDPELGQLYKWEEEYIETIGVTPAEWKIARSAGVLPDAKPTESDHVVEFKGKRPSDVIPKTFYAMTSIMGYPLGDYCSQNFLVLPTENIHADYYNQEDKTPRIVDYQTCFDTWKWYTTDKYHDPGTMKFHDKQKNYILYVQSRGCITTNAGVADVINKDDHIDLYIWEEGKWGSTADSEGFIIIIPTDMPIGTKINLFTCTKGDTVRALCGELSETSPFGIMYPPSADEQVKE